MSPSEQPSTLLREPFRIFFILGVLLSWVGVGHWLTYGLGWTSTYSCESHGSTQMQGFMMAFAIGFLLTALPRRTQSPPAGIAEVLVLMAALIAVAAANTYEKWVIAQLAYVAVFVTLGRFAITRLLGSGAGRRPPAAFVLIPIAVLHAVIGAGAIAAEALDLLPRSVLGFGQLSVQQGVFLCLVAGVGNLVLPLMGGTSPPADIDVSPRERARVVWFAAAGIAVFAGLVLEQAGYTRLGPILRATALLAGLGPNAFRRPGKPGLHRKLTLLAVWMIPLGLLASALWPDYRVAALHMMFIGGFGLMAFAVASHVSIGHLELGDLGLGRPWPVVAIAASFSAALAARLAADSADTYFIHLAWAASWWLLGTALWLAFFAPKMFTRP